MTECDLLELGSLSQIQSNGYVVCTHFVKEYVHMCIRNVSSNIGEASFSVRALQHDPLLFVGKCVTDCFSKRFADRLSTLLERYLGKKSVICSFTCDVSGRGYAVTLTRTTDCLVFEIIPNAESSFLVTGSYLRALTLHTEYAALFDAACAGVTDVANYDRAMIYQFQEDLSGKVVYEWLRPSCADTLEPYMNTYFPESDIPLPARQMFMTRPLRVIFDNTADPAKVLGGCTDLSKCLLRANHPVHRTYMKNMGVRSSMSIAIIVNNELWGLLCFHAYGEAVHPSGRDINIFESLSPHISLCLSKIKREHYEKRRAALLSILDKGFSTTDIFAFFAGKAHDLLRLMDADAVSIRLTDRVKTYGDTDLVPTVADVDRVSRGAIGRDWAIGKLLHPSRGVLCIVHSDLSIVFVRESISSDKAWAGDPSHVKLMRPDGVPGPRGSFERYIQSDADSLNKWSEHDQEVATYMSSRIKLLATTVKFFADKSNALVKANAANTKNTNERTTGQVDYSTSVKKRVLAAPLISHFSHELKTPLHGVSSVLTLLLEESGVVQDKDAREQLVYGLDCIKTIAKVVESVLTIAGGGEVGKSAHRNLESLCLETFVATLRKKFIHDGLTATSTVDEDHGHVTVDAKLLDETLSSIIDNSISTGSMGTTRLSVSCCSTHREATMAWTNDTEGFSHRNIRNSEDTSGISESDTWFTFSISDSGCGIYKDMLDNVLAYDTRSTTIALTNSHQGVGVDIYKCISNIFDMNGSVGIASTVSTGTIVSVMLPLKACGRNETTNKMLEGVPKDIGVFFVVDDNTVNRKLASRLLTVAFRKTMGQAPVIKEFGDGRLCIEEIKLMQKNGENILGVLMDHHMPVMSGKQATQFIRDNEVRHGMEKIPIFGYTADSAESTREELLASGMNDVLSKPISMKILEGMCLKTMCPKEN